jgi:MFS family permease
MSKSQHLSTPVGDNASIEDATMSPENEKKLEADVSRKLTQNPQTHSTRDPDTSGSLDLARHETTTTSISHQPSLTRTISRIPTATTLPSFSFMHEIAFISVISAAQLFTQAALAQSIAPLHVIGQSFGTTNPGQLSWLPAAYSLTVGTFILPAGRWGDLYGHKKIFMLGYFWFALWSLIAGFSVYSNSLIFFTFCRAMQGIGPALLLPNGIAVLSRTYPPGPTKDMVLSLFGATAPGGFLLGAVFSGIFTRFVWWPWAYWVLGMVLVLFGVMVIFVVPNMAVVGEKPGFAELDAIGAFLGVTGLVLFNFAWNQGPAAGWDQAYVYVVLIIGVALLVAFIWYEKKWASFPLVPVYSFTTDTRLVFGCEAMGWASFGIWVYYLW